MTARRFHNSISRGIAALVVTIMALAYSSCSSLDKFVKPDDKLLSKNRYTIEMPDGDTPPKEIVEALGGIEKYYLQTPNKRLLGVARMKMWIYCMSTPSKNNSWQRFIRDRGEPPVVYNEKKAYETGEQIKKLLASKGCFNSEVYFKLDTLGKSLRDIDVTYIIRPSSRYRIDSVIFYAETPEVNVLINKWRRESLIQKGDYYDQDILSEERNRIASRLRNEGYYYASSDLISYNVDTINYDYDEHNLSIKVIVSNLRIIDNNRDVTTRPLQKYHIDTIYIYSNVSEPGALERTVYTSRYRKYSTDYIFLHDKGHPLEISPKIIARSMYLFNNRLYSPTNTDQTYNSLLNLRNFKYINIDYQESPNSCDTNRMLNARVRLMNAKRQRIGLSVELNNSLLVKEKYQGLMSGNFGLETKLSYLNKNLFGGAELFKAEVSGLIELPKLALKNSNDGDPINNFTDFELGLDLSLDLPTFLFPLQLLTKFLQHSLLWQQLRPHTLISLGANYQYREYYFERALANIGFGYNWVKRNNGHQLLPLELTFVRYLDIDSAFNRRMESFSDARLKYQYSNHFIMDARYDFVHNTQQFGTRQDFDYIHISAESAGNLLCLISNLTNGPKDENEIKQYFGVPFSQYLRLNTEYKHYFYIGEKNTFVARIMAGIGFPYKNSYVMPYEKSFYGGGPTTMRAWHLRPLGPGNYHIGNERMFERVGDMQLVINLEHRFPIFSIFEGALFADIGNVWLIHESEEFPGGQFKFGDFYKSIATGIGFGLRANISIVTVRCDFSIPLYDPGQLEGERWRIPYWHIRQVIANIGIDYPF